MTSVSSPSVLEYSKLVRALNTGNVPRTFSMASLSLCLVAYALLPHRPDEGLKELAAPS